MFVVDGHRLALIERISLCCFEQHRHIDLGGVVEFDLVVDPGAIVIRSVRVTSHVPSLHLRRTVRTGTRS